MSPDAIQITFAQLGTLVVFISVVLGAGASFGTLVVSQKFFAKDLSALKTQVGDVKNDLEKGISSVRVEIKGIDEKVGRRLYNPDGTTVFITRSECRECAGRDQKRAG